jgi:hypothetical protein
MIRSDDNEGVQTMSRWIRFSTLCALLGLGLCLGTTPAMADPPISLNTSPGLPAAGTPDTNGYTSAFYTNATINAFTTFPTTPLQGGAPAPTASGLPAGANGYYTPVVVGPNGTFPVGPGQPWLPNTLSSSWIGPNNHGQSNAQTGPPGNGFDPNTSAPQGYYYYDKSFTLTSTAGEAVTGGLWATDNNGIAIYLNGHFEGNTTPAVGFTQFYPFTVNSADLVQGVNHIDFVVFNETFLPVHNSPTGLRVEGSVNVVPEPSTVAFAALGAIGFIGYGLRRRRKVQGA